MSRLPRITYLLFAVGMIAAGVVGFSLSYGLLPDMAADLDAETLHLTQEASAGVLALGLLSGWCGMRYEQSGAAQWVLVIFFLAIAVIHWVDYLAGRRPLESPLTNSVPALVLLGMKLLRRETKNSP